MRQQREIAAANGFNNRGVTDMGFIKKICTINKELKSVDK